MRRLPVCRFGAELGHPPFGPTVASRRLPDGGVAWSGYGDEEGPMDIPQERKVVSEIPGPRSLEWIARRNGAMPSAFPTVHGIVAARASGAIVEDVDGNRLIDFATGIAVLNVGHTADDVVEAIERQLERDTHTSGVTANEPSIELAERLNAAHAGRLPEEDVLRELRRRGRGERR